MGASNRTIPLVLAASFFAAANCAVAGPQSVLDPYAYVPAPRPVARAPKAKPAQRPSYQSQLPRSGGSYAQSSSGGGVMDGVKQVGDGIANTTKAAGGAVVNSTKAAGGAVVNGGKAAGGAVVNGSKAVGGGIAAGAKKSGGLFVSGAQAVGQGFAALGGKIKDGSAAAGGKLASAPNIFKKGDDTPKQNRRVAEAPRAEAEPNPEPKPAPASAPVSGGPALRDSISTPAPAAAQAPDQGGGMMDKMTAMPKAIGGGMKSAANTTGRVVSAPFRKVGKFFGRGGDEPPRATAQGPGATK